VSLVGGVGGGVLTVIGDDEAARCACVATRGGAMSHREYTSCGEGNKNV
jgi:hypothetical protein